MADAESVARMLIGLGLHDQGLIGVKDLPDGRIEVTVESEECECGRWLKQYRAIDTSDLIIRTP